MSAPTGEFDVVVSGSGPSGSTAAHVSASAGLKILLVEKRGPPRDKTCGGLLTKHCVELIRSTIDAEVPQDVQIRPSPMPVFVAPPSGLAAGFLVPQEYVLNVTRRAFDGWLARLATSKGAQLCADSEVLGYEPEKDGVRVFIRTPTGVRQAHARYLIGADGLYSAIRTQMKPRSLLQRAYYIQEYYPRTGNFEDWFYLMYRRSTSPIYAYVIPKNDLLCVGLGIHTSVPPTFQDGMAELKDWLASDFGFHDEGVVKREGFPVPHGGVVYGAERVLLAGDAAGFCYPPTGEGITFAIQSGAAAAAAIARGGGQVLQRYTTEMSRVAELVELAAKRILGLTDKQREERIKMKAGL